ncbi:hypothetical protein VP01_616g5 [Puccinia sorghi]|uniref:DUF4219 domain-containing protein n=1 Tax=Puccinia sorghi TaxID=27349 RepID=A0A0L6UHM2_9BASI|nr:hypothetical protein VP01_616g5 [Puccinia sorghi]
MDAINPTILKTTIEAIPFLTEDNFSSWRTQINVLFKLGGLLATTHKNVVTSKNKDNTIALWKAILKRFNSWEPSYQAQIYNQFAYIMFDSSNIENFITEVRVIIVKMEDVGIHLQEDIITYGLLRRLPSSLENIKKSITHSRKGKDIKPKILLDHLEIHLNELKVSCAVKSEATTIFTKEGQYIPGKHNPYS